MHYLSDCRWKNTQQQGSTIEKMDDPSTWFEPKSSRLANAHIPNHNHHNWLTGDEDSPCIASIQDGAKHRIFRIWKNLGWLKHASFWNQKSPFSWPSHLRSLSWSKFRFCNLSLEFRSRRVRRVPLLRMIDRVKARVRKIQKYGINIFKETL